MKAACRKLERTVREACIAGIFREPAVAEDDAHWFAVLLRGRGGATSVAKDAPETVAGLAAMFKDAIRGQIAVHVKRIRKDAIGA